MLKTATSSLIKMKKIFNININEKIVELYTHIFIEGSEDRDIPKFMTVTKMRTGKIVHRYVDSQYVYIRSKVNTDGRAYFICSVKDCPVKLHAKYESKEMSCGNEEPVITT